MARKDIHAMNIIEENNSYPMMTAVEDRFLNKISDFPSKGNQALETAGVFTGKEADISIEDVLRHSSYFKLIGKSTLKNSKNDGIKKFWLRYDLENVSGEDLDFFLYSRDIFLKIDGIYFANATSKEWSEYNVSDYKKVATALNFDRSPSLRMRLKSGDKGVLIVRAKSMINSISLRIVDSNQRELMRVNYSFMLAILLGVSPASLYLTFYST